MIEYLRTRNYLVHYDDSICKNHRNLDEFEMSIYNKVLVKVLEYYILKELGFPIDTIYLDCLLDERWGNVSLELNMIKLSRKTN